MDPHGPKIYPNDKASEATEPMLRGVGELLGGDFAIRLGNELSGLQTREPIPAAGEDEQHGLQRTSPALFSLRFLWIQRVRACSKVVHRFLTLLRPQNEGIELLHEDVDTPMAT